MASSNDLKTIELLKKRKVYPLFKSYTLLKDYGIKEAIKKKKNNDKYYNINLQKHLNFERNEVYFITETKKDYEYINKSSFLREFLSQNNLILKVYKIIKKDHKNEKDYELSYIDFVYNFKYRTFVTYNINKTELDYNYSYIKIKSIEEFITNFNSLEYLKLYSNYCNKNNVSVLTGSFLTHDGKNFFSGGAERYLTDLSKILEEKNINMDIYQEGDFPFFRKYKNINIISLPFIYKDKDKSFEKKQLIRNLSFAYNASKMSQLIVYSPFFECFPIKLTPSIGISHGVGWDNMGNKWIDGIHFDVEKYHFIKSAQLCDRLVSVDTNTCNWFQTIDYDIGVNKFEYIPNYVDIKEFSPREDYLKERKKIVITYPRRLYSARGLYLMLHVSEILVKKYKNIEIHFVGKGTEKDVENVKQLMNKYPKQIFCYSKDQDKMNEVYKKTDICVIPTIMSEGTSLSCLEAMASASIVVATRIGGLSNLIINKHNGYLIEPNEESLLNTLTNILDNYKENLKYKKMALETSRAFNKKDWIAKWEKIFDEFNLKESEKTIDLVEYRVEDFNNIKEEVKERIKNDLIDNKLVYVFCKNKNIFDLVNKYQAGRLQIIDKIDETILKKHTIYYENDIK